MLCRRWKMTAGGEKKKYPVDYEVRNAWEGNLSHRFDQLLKCNPIRFLKVLWCLKEAQIPQHVCEVPRCISRQEVYQSRLQWCVHRVLYFQLNQQIIQLSTAPCLGHFWNGLRCSFCFPARIMVPVANPPYHMHVNVCLQAPSQFTHTL